MRITAPKPTPIYTTPGPAEKLCACGCGVLMKQGKMDTFKWQRKVYFSRECVKRSRHRWK